MKPNELKTQLTVVNSITQIHHLLAVEVCKTEKNVGSIFFIKMAGRAQFLYLKIYL